MIVKKPVKIYIILITVLILILFFYLNSNQEKEIEVVKENIEDTSYNSNIIKDVNTPVKMQMEMNTLSLHWRGK